MPEQIRQILHRVEAGDLDAHGVNENRTKDGRLIWCQWFNTPMMDQAGHFNGAISLAQDITGRRRVEKALEEARIRFQAIFETALDSIMLMDDAAQFVDVNPATCEMLGYSRAELLRMTVADVAPAPVHANAAGLVDQFFAEGKISGTYQLLCKNGVLRDVEYHSVTNILPGLHLAVYRDVSERKSAEDKLKTSAFLLAEAQRLAHVGNWNWDLRTNAIHWSDEHYRIFGLQPHEIDVTYEQFLTFVHPDDRAMVKSVVDQALKDRQPFDYRLRILHRNGTIRLLQSRGRVSMNEQDKPVRMYGVVLDITERQQAEDALRESAQRLEILSHRVVEIQEQERRHLAHELHDEIGQVLSAIAINLRATKATCDEFAKSRLEESINLVEHAIQQVRNLSLDLRPSMLDDLGLISTLRWYADRQAQRAGFVLHFTAESAGDRLPADLEIACYRVVQEALTNVVRHAHANEVWVEFTARDEEIEIAVRDDGCGFDLPSVLSNASRGASFGVLGMKERVALLHGQFKIKSEPGRGTSIRVFLPLSTYLTVDALGHRRCIHEANSRFNCG